MHNGAFFYSSNFLENPSIPPSRIQGSDLILFDSCNYGVKGTHYICTSVVLYDG